MASTNKFPSGLNNWLGSDKPQRLDFVNDNRIVDEHAMWKREYDPDGSVAAAGGVAALLERQKEELKTVIDSKANALKCFGEEQLTGDIWLDGKPIYQQQFQYGMIPNIGPAWQAKMHGIPGIEVVTSWFCFGIDTTRQYTISVPHFDAEDITATGSVRAYVNRFSASLCTDSGFFLGSVNYYFTIRYTKL